MRVVSTGPVVITIPRGGVATNFDSPRDPRQDGPEPRNRRERREQAAKRRRRA